MPAGSRLLVVVPGLLVLSAFLVGDGDHSLVELFAIHAWHHCVQLVRLLLNGASVYLPEVVVLATVRVLQAGGVFGLLTVAAPVAANLSMVALGGTFPRLLMASLSGLTLGREVADVREVAQQLVGLLCL